MSKIAFLYPGQGAQYVGMGKDLYENNAKAKQYFDSIFDGLEIDLKTVMFEGPEETLKETKYTQPAIVAMSLVLTKLFIEEKDFKFIGDIVISQHNPVHHGAIFNFTYN